MGLFETNGLPGVFSQILSENNSGYDTSLFNTTESVLIIGTAFDGPVGKVVSVYNTEHARNLFGPAYDYASRKEASLVAGINDAWQRGCKTIYAVRVSGVDVQKQFKLRQDGKFKLQVRNTFPSNANKDVYMLYERTSDNRDIVKIFKPTRKATSIEKQRGIVESDSNTIAVNINLTEFGFGAESRLVDVIETINSHPFNNVLNLSIVDKNGSDATAYDKDTDLLTLGDVFEGVYFIGRDQNNIKEDKVVTKIEKTFNGKSIYAMLIVNTDINEQYPIFATGNELKEALAELNIPSMESYSFLYDSTIVDVAYGKDAVDYEEVDLGRFELYQKLGSGFANCAIFDRERGIVRDADRTKEGGIASIDGGVYSVLEQIPTDYRVLTCANANDRIKGRMPSKSDFEYAASCDANVSDVFKVKSNVDPKDFSPAQYLSVKISIDDLHLLSKEESTAIEQQKKYIEFLPSVSDQDVLKDGQKAIIGSQIFERHNDDVVAIELSDNKYFMTTVDGETYNQLKSVDGVLVSDEDATEAVIVDCDNTLIVFKNNIPYSNLSNVINEEEDRYAVITLAKEVEVEDKDGNKTKEIAKDVKIIFNQLRYLTFVEAVELVNSDIALESIASIELDKKMIQHAGDNIFDVVQDDMFVDPVIFENKVVAYDSTLKIPYRTTDNFARQLAQHCTQTGFMTGSTHGVIGLSPLFDLSIGGVNKKIEETLLMNLDLYGKKQNGTNVLDNNNLPYHIGHNISIPAFQYKVKTDDGYLFTSNGASGYAGSMSVTPIESGSINQKFDVSSYDYDLTSYLSKLNRAGFVTIKNSQTKGVVITDGVTQGLSESPFRRRHLMKLSNMFERLVRTASEPFLGKANSDANRNSLEAAIKSAVAPLEGKLIRSWDYKLNVKKRGNLAELAFDYVIVPLDEIVEITNRITIKESM